MLEHPHHDVDSGAAYPERDGCALEAHLLRLAPRITRMVAARLRQAPGVLGHRVRRVEVTVESVAPLLSALARERPELDEQGEPSLVILAATFVRRRLVQGDDLAR
jgi:hypothetical protein